MPLAGLTTEGLFRAVGLVPTSRPSQIVGTSLQWNYTTVLNIIFLFVFGALYWTYRNRERLGGGRGYAIDPVCGMQVEAAQAPASCERDGMQVYFCSDRCREKFEKSADPISRAHASVARADHGHA